MSNRSCFTGKSQKILIVDDEPYNTRVLRLKFENAGYTVIVATDGLDGLGKFKIESPDVVITDIKMPIMNGREMCKSMKEAGNGRSFLIIVITSTVDQIDRLWVNGMGNASLVEKPISPGHILTLVNDYFNKPVP